MNLKIRTAQLQKVPYMLVVGDKEQAGETVSVRHREEGDLGPMGLAGLAERMRGEVGGRLAGIL
jgi:threonyl-tRNA synthetase